MPEFYANGPALSLSKGEATPREVLRAEDLPFSQQVRIHLLLGFAKRHVGRSLDDLLLPVAAAGALHDVHRLQIIVSAVGIGGIVRERDPVEGIGAKERRIVTVTSSATELVRSLGQLMPPAFKGRHGSRRLGSSLLAEQRLPQ